jgi:OFA family oxalate/formate antiporter-like MFS transporter
MPNPPSAARGWTVVFAALAINLVLGSLYAWTTMAKAIGEQWHWTREQTALPFSVATACFATMMIFAGRLQDKIGPRFVATAGGIILGLGLLASSWTTTPLVMALTFGGIGGIGIGLGYSATTPPSIKWFPPARKGLITGLVVSGIGLSAVYISPLTQHLLKKSSIAQTFTYLGLGTIVVVALLSQLIANPPSGYVPASASGAVSGGKPGSVMRRDVDWPEMLRSPQFYQLWFMMVLSASAGLMIIVHVAFIAKEQAGIEKWGFLPVAILAIFNTLGRVVGGFLSDRLGRTRTMCLAFVLQAINMFIFVKYTTPGLIIFGAGFTGVCYGTLFPLMPSAIADFFGVKNLGVNYGLLFTGFGLAGVFGPKLGGRIHDHFHSYSYSYTISAVMLLVGAAVALTVRTPKGPASEPLKAAARPKPELLRT